MDRWREGDGGGVVGASEKQIPCGNDRKKGNGKSKGKRELGAQPTVEWELLCHLAYERSQL